MIDGKVYYKKGIKDYRHRYRRLPKSIPGYKQKKYPNYLFVHNGKIYDIRTGKYFKNFVEIQ